MKENGQKNKDKYEWRPLRGVISPSLSIYIYINVRGLHLYIALI